MTAENKKGNRTEISFFDNPDEGKFLLSRTAHQIYELLDLEPEYIVKAFHELWRNSKDYEIYQIVLEDPVYFVQNFVGTGDFTEGVKNLHVEREETLDKSIEFSGDVLTLIRKAAYGLSFYYPINEEFTNLNEPILNKMHNDLVEAKKQHLLDISRLN